MGMDGVSPGGAMRLLLVDATRTLAPELADAMGAEFSHMPIVVDVSAGRLALDLLRSSEFDVVAADLDALTDLSERAEDRIGKLVRAARMHW